MLPTCRGPEAAQGGLPPGFYPTLPLPSPSPSHIALDCVACALHERHTACAGLGEWGGHLPQPSRSSNTANAGRCCPVVDTAVPWGEAVWVRDCVGWAGRWPARAVAGWIGEHCWAEWTGWVDWGCQWQLGLALARAAQAFWLVNR